METWQHENPERRALPAGEWDDEPDKAVWVDEATGLDCMIHRNRMGALCGYVGVPDGHPWYGHDFAEHDELCVHGHLTYSAPCSPTSDPAHGICHVPAPGRPHDVWWLGFDCCHAGDLAPSTLLLGPLPFAPVPPDQYRNFAYVRAQVEHLAQQVATIDPDA